MVYKMARVIWSRNVLIKLFGLMSASFINNNVLANPVLDNVAAGNVTIENSATTTTINQSSQKAIINWQSFNIAQPETTHFQQPQGGVTLNRINPAQGASEIYGRLTSTGRIILVNPAGFYFGPSAYVNVGGIIVSTANILDQNFLNDNYYFNNTSAYNGAIINQGQIIAAEHGLVALVGGAVSNDGMIQARLGHSILASGESFTMSFAGNDLISFSVDTGIKRRAVDRQGNELADGVKNTGSIIADGGQILVSAKAASGVLSQVVNIQGIVKARSVAKSGGDIIFSASPKSGVVRVAGKINASGKSANQKGGNITIVGENILLDSTAVLDVSGYSGAGNIYVGGNAHGAPITLSGIANSNSVMQNASNVHVAPGALLVANALEDGNGGNITVWSDNSTQFLGNIEARGGSNGGNGGWAEVSSKNNLYFEGNANLSAAQGKLGTLLLDPKNITVATGGAAALNAVDQFSDTPAASLTIAPATINAAVANVVLQANNDITFSNPISLGAGISFTAQAGRSILLNAGISTNNANILLSANDLGAILANRDAGLGSISGTGALVATSAGTITLQVGSNANAGNITTGAITTASGLVSVTTPGTITTNGAITTTGGNASLNAGGSITIPQNISIGAGVLNLTSGDTITINRSGANHNITSGTLTINTNNINISNTLSNNNTSVITTGLLTMNVAQNFTLFGRSVGGVGGFTRVRSGVQNITVGNQLLLTMGTGATGVNNFGELVSTTGAQTINAGSISLQSSAQGVMRIQGFGTQNITTTTGAITLTGNSASNNVVISNQASSTLNLTAATNILSNGFGTLSATTVNLKAQGNIGQLNNTDVISATNLSTETTTGTTSLNSSLNTVANLGAKSVSGSASLRSSGNINLVASDLGSGALSLTSGGNITQTGVVISNGLTLALTSSSKNILLADYANNFGASPVAFTGNLTNVANLQLRNINANAQLGDLSTLTQLQQVTIVHNNASLILNNPITANAAGTAIILVGAGFTNNVGANGLVAPNGFYQVWSGSPLSDNRGGLSYNFKQYGATYGVSTVLGAGNGFLYTLSPILTPQLVGTIQKNYDKTDVATLTPSNYSLDAIDGDTVLATYPTVGTYAQINVGSNINVAVNGISIPSSPSPNAVNGGANVYGYQLSSTTANANIGEITPLTLTYTANPATRAYGDANPVFSGTVTGFVSGDTIANATTGVMVFDTSATPLSDPGRYPIIGSGLIANNGNYNFIQNNSNFTALTIESAPSPAPDIPYNIVFSPEFAAHLNKNNLLSEFNMDIIKVCEKITPNNYICIKVNPPIVRLGSLGLALN